MKIGTLDRHMKIGTLDRRIKAGLKRDMRARKITRSLLCALWCAASVRRCDVPLSCAGL